MGFGWQTSQPNAEASAPPETCFVCAPTRTASPLWPRIVRGGAPVPLSVPPWHMTQFTFQLATPAGRPASWQLPQPMPTCPPERSAPWHSPQERRFALAAYAWKPSLAGFIQAAPWPDDWICAVEVLAAHAGPQDLAGRVDGLGVADATAGQVGRDRRVRRSGRNAVAGAAGAGAAADIRPDGRVGGAPALERAVAVDGAAGTRLRNELRVGRTRRRGRDPAEADVDLPVPVRGRAAPRVGVAGRARERSRDGAGLDVRRVCADAPVRRGGRAAHAAGRRAGVVVRAAVAARAGGVAGGLLELVQLPPLAAGAEGHEGDEDRGATNHLLSLPAGKRRRLCESHPSEPVPRRLRVGKGCNERPSRDCTTRAAPSYENAPLRSPLRWGYLAHGGGNHP